MRFSVAFAVRAVYHPLCVLAFFEGCEPLFTKVAVLVLLEKVVKTRFFLHSIDVCADDFDHVSAQLVLKLDFT